MDAATGTLFLVMISFTAGCQRESLEVRAAAAKQLFEQASKEFHIPATEARGAERDRLLGEAASGYDRVVRTYPEQAHWAAQALRNLASIRAAQSNLAEAVQLYTQVGARYPDQDWEVLMAWKAAGDLLAEAGRRRDAADFYRRIVERFDRPDASQVVQLTVRGARAQLSAGADLNR